LVDNYWVWQWEQKALVMDKKDSLFRAAEGVGDQHPLNKAAFQMENDISSLEHTGRK
jgi:hypothetical protein